MKKHVAELIALTAELQNKAKQVREAEEAADQAAARQMSLFPEDVRAIPNHLARSPLFAPIRPGRRATRKDEHLPSPKGVEIRYSGEQLDQADCDVFMQLIHEQSGKTMGQPVQVIRAEFLQQIGRADGGKNYQWLKTVFDRLQTAVISVESPRYHLRAQLLGKTLEDKQEGVFSIVLDPDIVKMFSGAEYSIVDWQKRKMLEVRVDLAKWLHNFTCSHERGAQRWTVAALREWSGYASPLRKFREALREALHELDRVGIISRPTFYERDTKVKWTRL